MMKKTMTRLIQSLTLTTLLAASGCALAESLAPMIDDFTDATDNNLGQPRQFMNDTLSGGHTTTQQAIENGVLQMTGDIVPPRGQPGWASSVLPLGPMGMPQDASQYQGVRLMVRINHGNLTLSANSTEITNFDYHAAPVFVTADGQFHEVKIPFESMKRGWSEQVQLNTNTLNSLSIVAYSLQQDSFDFEVDEVSFY
ncbi:hypothetical protein KUL150_22070 [Alteromonas sp. KUL150]|nr:hypothetical protein KUL150_22070 [Alteromonas sp. KUL150]